MTIVLQTNELSALKRFIQQLALAYPDFVQQIVLYGSKARGDATPDSDIDVLVVLLKEDGEIRRNILTIAARVSLDCDVLINALVVGKSRLRQQQDFTLYRNINDDAIRLTIKDNHLNLIPGSLTI